jgi:hypothetical protein
MAMPEEWMGLIGAARKDFQAIALFQDRAELADEIFGFHAQQTVEKGLKAWI